MENQETKAVEKPAKVKLTAEEIKANRAAASKRTLEKRKAKGIAAKQFFIRHIMIITMNNSYNSTMTNN